MRDRIMVVTSSNRSTRRRILDAGVDLASETGVTAVNTAVTMGTFAEAELLAFQLDGIYLAHHVARRLDREPEADLRARRAVDALPAPSPPDRPGPTRSGCEGPAVGWPTGTEPARGARRRKGCRGRAGSALADLDRCGAVRRHLGCRAGPRADGGAAAVPARLPRRAGVRIAPGLLAAAVVGVAALAGLRLQHSVDPAVLLVGAALLLMGWAVVRRRFLPPADGVVQIVGWCVFVGSAALAVSVGPAVGTPVVAAGWAAHAVWDLYHWVRDSGVARSFAEWCGVVDLLGAIAVLSTSAA